MFHVYWPVLSFLTLMIVVGVIIILLRFGPLICGTRHTTLPEETYWQARPRAQRGPYESYA